MAKKPEPRLRGFDMTADLDHPREDKPAPVKKKRAQRTAQPPHIDFTTVKPGSAAVTELVDRWQKYQNSTHPNYQGLKLKTWTLVLYRGTREHVIDKRQKRLYISVVNARGNLVGGGTLCNRLDIAIDHIRFPHLDK